MKTSLATIVTVVGILIALSIIMIYSTSGIFAQEKFADENYYLKKQMIWVSVSLFCMIVFSYLPYRILRPLALVGVFAALALLVVTLLSPLGQAAGGASRWLKLGPFRFQPSEIAKLAIIVYMADVVARKQATVTEFFKSLLAPSILVGIVLVCVLKQPDLGTTVLLACTWMVIMFIGGIRFRYVVIFIMTGVVNLYFLIKLFPYRMKRIISFLDPFKDPHGSGFQIIQSFIALGSGGLHGVGLGQGTQKLFYLPEAHTDFIFAIIGEELGLIGTSSIVLLFAVFCISGMMIAYKCTDIFGKLLAAGITMMITAQALINMCVVTGMLPTKGIPLPFLSFGGSNLLVNSIAIGILINVGVRGNEQPENAVLKTKRNAAAAEYNKGERKRLANA
ncbi:MAG: putative lipid II flippase FtsW [Candidatus Auribacterota bacterium]